MTQTLVESIFMRGRFHAQVTEYVTDAQVLRGGEYVSVDSRSLVPGDLLVVKDSWLLPCDLLILEGVLLPFCGCSQVAYIFYVACFLHHPAKSMCNLQKGLGTC